jgi:ribosomal protein S18 acetylase RimI-like enzyme
MITFRSVSDCTWREMTDIWNKGFEGYFVPLHFDEKQLNVHFAKGDISPQHSFLACYDGKPAGFILNGFRQIDGKKVAWNGGTGVKKEFRGKGVGKALIQECLSLYKEEQVDIATLEAIELNIPAIRLYEKFGYSITDNLYFYTAKNISDLSPTPKIDYKFIHTNNKAIRKLAIWNKWTPWQNQIINFPDDSRAVIMLDRSKNSIGYALYRDIFDDDGDKAQTVLLHCEVTEIPNKKYLTEQLLAQVFHSPNNRDKNYLCSTYNLLVSTHLRSVFQEWGFSKQTGQVWMQQNLTGK